MHSPTTPFLQTYYFRSAYGIVLKFRTNILLALQMNVYNLVLCRESHFDVLTNFVSVILNLYKKYYNKHLNKHFTLLIEYVCA